MITFKDLAIVEHNSRLQLLDRQEGYFYLYVSKNKGNGIYGRWRR